MRYVLSGEDLSDIPPHWGPQLVRDAGRVGRRAPDREASQHDRRQPARPGLPDGPKPHRDPDSGGAPLLARHARGLGHRGRPGTWPLPDPRRPSHYANDTRNLRIAYTFTLLVHRTLGKTAG